jgi:hypothetical protein
MPVRERDYDAICAQGREPVDRVRHEAGLQLLPVRDHGRAGRLELDDRLLERLLEQCVQFLPGDSSSATPSMPSISSAGLGTLPIGSVDTPAMLAAATGSPPGT